MYIYRLTIEINNEQKFYIGKCATGNPNYMGSGKILKAFYRKYGKEILKKREILFETNNEKELNEAEVYYINFYNAVSDKNYLNISIGGTGGNTYAGLTKTQIKYAIQKRRNFYKKNPHVLEQSIEKMKRTINDPNIKQKIKESLKKSIHKRIENYKISRKNNSEERKSIISLNLSLAQKAAYTRKTPEQKRIKKEKEMETKRNRTIEQKQRESNLKSESSKRTAKERAEDPDKMLAYSKKVSEGITRWRNSLSEERRQEIKFKCRLTKYRNNGMLAYESEIRSMIDVKSSLEIYHFFLKKGIMTHHICVQGFIDFLRKFSPI